MQNWIQVHLIEFQNLIYSTNFFQQVFDFDKNTYDKNIGRLHNPIFNNCAPVVSAHQRRSVEVGQEHVALPPPK